MRYFPIKVFFLILFFSPAAWGLTPTELAQEAQRNYERGDFSQAAEKWKGLLEMGFVNGDVLFNLGTAYWRQGRVGQARQYFLKAAALSPRDPDIRANLNFVEEKLGERPAGEGIGAWVSRIPLWRLSMNFSESLWVAAIFSCFCFGLFLWRRLAGVGKFRKMTAAMMVLFLISLLQLSIRVRQEYFSPKAVVIVPSAGLLTAPVSTAKAGVDLKEGTLLNIEKKEGNFYLVKLASNQEGWVEKSQIGEI